MKYITLLIFSIFLIMMIQTANAQIITNHNGGKNSNLTSAASKYRNNTPAGQAGLIQNNPGYTIYLPHTSSYPENTAKIAREGSNFSTYTTKYINNTPAGQAGLINNNPGYAKYIPNTNSLNNATGLAGIASNFTNNNAK